MCIQIANGPFVGARLLWRIIGTSIFYVATVAAGYALVFNFSASPETPAPVIAALQSAGERWSTQLVDNVTVNLTFAFAPLGPSTRAQTSSSMGTISYAGFRTALSQDQTSILDAIAVSHLPNSSVALLINRTSDNPNGPGSAIAVLDNNASANNTTIRTTFANAKALGLLPANNPAVDASISVNSLLAWDFDLTNGLTPGSRDFIGTATHEIGHALGFVSGVDILDANSPPVGGPFSSNTFTFVSPLDLFRFSTLSAANNAIDWTSDTRAKFFSVDRGATIGAMFSTGVNFGDGDQASHWKDNLGLGIMDPTAGIAEIRSLSQNDLQAMDAIGWNRVPDAGSTLSHLGVTVVLLVAASRRRIAAAVDHSNNAKPIRPSLSRPSE